MAKVLKRQESLASAFKKRTGLGLGLAVTGVVIIIFFTQVGIVGVILIILGCYHRLRMDQSWGTSWGT